VSGRVKPLPNPFERRSRRLFFQQNILAILPESGSAVRLDAQGDGLVVRNVAQIGA
jgi:hypothetical protein